MSVNAAVAKGTHQRILENDYWKDLKVETMRKGSHIIGYLICICDGLVSILKSNGTWIVGNSFCKKSISWIHQIHITHLMEYF